jgi:hypothetical protein
MLTRIATSDESWVCHFQTESEYTSLQWKHSRLPVTKKFKIVPSASKVFGLLVHFEKLVETISVALYSSVQWTFRDLIHGKQPVLLRRRLLLLHYNGRLSAMHATQEIIQERKWELLGHFSYCLDIRNPLEEHLHGKCFSGVAEVEHEMHFLCVWFSEVDKATGQVYKCFMGLCGKVNGLFG